MRCDWAERAAARGVRRMGAVRAEAEGSENVRGQVTERHRVNDQQETDAPGATRSPGENAGRHRDPEEKNHVVDRKTTGQYVYQQNEYDV